MSVRRPRGKRTRPIRGKYFLTVPRVAIHEPGIYEIKVKLSQVIIEKVKELREPQNVLEAVEKVDLGLEPGEAEPGEIERGRVDGEEERE